MAFVESTKGRLALLRIRTEPEGKDLLVEEALVDHVVEGRDDVRDGDGVVAEAEDSVKLAAEASALAGTRIAPW